ncbi:DUF1576 domain-containing protein [Clostridium sp. LIBA-8841]|uniref:DUF1576 domain-containing protein n=1 Tax=Clostridium sp. LIBA-8841 TaxID=2987530 RepID=UPI002AC3CD79|nr:DUF1576 domain-containing protein [Clostridium sp. LIBA-8841]MDZ5255250.1 DUF1576 domain-containing protein [Clostridium sp. LIBA-8841]
MKRLPQEYLIHLILYISFIILAFFLESPKEIVTGLHKIILNSDILITDYISIGGFGATLINSALLGIIFIFLFYINDIKSTGRSIMSLWFLTGFGMFGKNIVNIWPIILGTWIYSKVKKKPFKDYLVVASLGTALAPTVSQFSFFPGIHPISGTIMGTLVGMIIGFILPPIAQNASRIHSGFSLYNVGFAGGIIAIAVMSLMKAVGHNFETNSIWHKGNNNLYIVFLLVISAYFIICSLILDKSKKRVLKDQIGINKEHGIFPSDFFSIYGSSCYFNMGVLCIFSTLFVLLINGDLNGPTIGAIFAMAGFGCYGKNLANSIPLIIGASLASLISISDINSPVTVVCILFSTGLAPISGYYGWPYGIIAGFLHIFIVFNIGELHGGLNLYNNGLAGGFVAAIIVPVIESLQITNTKNTIKSSFKNPPISLGIKKEAD